MRPPARHARPTVEPLAANLPRPGAILMLLAPFAAVAVGLYLLRSAWLAILLYHAQIIGHAARCPRDAGVLRRGWSPRWFAGLGLSGLMVAALLPALLDPMLRSGLELGPWLGRHGLAGAGLPLFGCYYGLVHPVLEQHHWDPLRRDPRLGPVAHVAFAAYHLPVLVLFVKPGWAVLCCAVLLGASLVWARARARLGGLLVPVLSHLIADAGMIAAVCLRVAR